MDCLNYFRNFFSPQIKKHAMLGVMLGRETRVCLLGLKHDRLKPGQFLM